MTAPVLITAAPNGARRMKTDHPALPLTACEIAACAEACLKEGAAMLHLHVRDDEGAHSLDPARYDEAIAAVRERVGERMIIQITTEAAGRYGVSAQMDVVRRVRPEAASCALREMAATAEDIPAYLDFLGGRRTDGVAIQHILYSPTDISRFLRLLEDLPPDPPPQALLVFGRDAAAKGAAALLTEFEAAGAGAAGVAWSVCGFAALEHDVARAALARGWHVRVGFENNLNRTDGQPYADNAESVRAVRLAAQSQGRRALTAEEARRVFFNAA